MKEIACRDCSCDLDLCNQIMLAQDEEEVLDLLVKSPSDLKYSNARYYDAIKCPFDQIFFYVFRKSNRNYKDFKKGDKIYDSSM